MTAPARAPPQETTGMSQGFLPRELSPEELSLTSGNHRKLSTRTGDGLVLADAPDPLVPYTERGRL